MLHKARLVSDGFYAIQKAAEDAESMNVQEKKRKILAAAPAYLKGRVEKGQELPAVEIRDAIDVRREIRDERKRKLSLFKRITRWFRHDDEKDDIDEMGPHDEDEMRADVLEFVATGGKLLKEVFIELMEYLVPTWDDARRAL